MNILYTYHHAGRHYAAVDLDGKRVEFAFDREPTDKDIEDHAQAYLDRLSLEVEEPVNPVEAELERVREERDYYKAKVEELEKEAEK